MEENTHNQNTAGPIEMMTETIQSPEQRFLPMVADHAPMNLLRDESLFESATSTSKAVLNDGSGGSCTTAAMVGNVDLGQTAMDTPFTFTREQLLASSTYPNGNTLMAGLVDVDPACGTVTDNGDGTWTYSPLGGFTGDDVQISFTVSDGNGGFASARALLDVTANDNRPPVTGNVDLGSMEEDGTLIFSAAQLLAGASDTDGDILTITAVTVNPHYGAVTNNGNGTWTFTPSESFHDFDVPLIFAVENGNGDTDTAVALVDVIAAPDLAEAHDMEPQLNDDDRTLNFTPAQLLSNTREAKLEPLSGISATANAIYGDIVDNGDGTWSLTPTLHSLIDISFKSHGENPSCAEHAGAFRRYGIKPSGHSVDPRHADIRFLSSAIFRKNTHFQHTKYF